MKYCVETLTPELQQEVHALISRYYPVTAASDGQPPFNYRWEVYTFLESGDQTLTVTARDEDGTLCGFVMYLFMEHPHHRGLRVAQCDGIAVDMTKRGQGIGRMLYTVAESVLIELGINRVTHHHHLAYNTTPLFPKLGFTLSEQVYVKELG